MRLDIRISTIVLAVVMFVAVCPNPVRAERPTTPSAWFNDAIVYVIPGISPNVLGITNPTIAAKVANSLYLDGS